MLGNEELLAVREDYDGAEPAANHLAAENLIKLATLLDLADYAVRAESLLRAGSTVIEKQAFAVPVLLVALDLHLRGLAKCQVPADADPATLGKLGSLYQPRAVFTSDEGSDVIVCEGQSCRLFV